MVWKYLLKLYVISRPIQSEVPLDIAFVDFKLAIEVTLKREGEFELDIVKVERLLRAVIFDLRVLRNVRIVPRF